MRSFFYCTKVVRNNGATITHTSGIAEMRVADIREVQKLVAQGLLGEGIEVDAKDVIVLAFNPL